MLLRPFRLEIANVPVMFNLMLDSKYSNKAKSIYKFSPIQPQRAAVLLVTGNSTQKRI